MAIDIANKTIIIGASLLGILIVLALVAVGKRSKQFSKAWRKLFKKSPIQDSLAAFGFIYSAYLITFGFINENILKEIINRSGVNEEALQTLIGTTTGAGLVFSYWFIILIGTYLFAIALALIVTYAIGKQMFSLNLDYATTLVIILWTIGMFLLILQLGFFLWISLFGLVLTILFAVI